MDNNEIIGYIIAQDERIFIVGLGCATEEDEEIGIPLTWLEFVDEESTVYCDDCGRDLMYCYDSRL